LAEEIRKGNIFLRIYRFVPVPKFFGSFEVNQTGHRERHPASVLAPESALGSVPTVALSSAQAGQNCNGNIVVVENQKDRI